MCQSCTLKKTLFRQVSDALCRLSTGGGFRTRRLHTDDDEVLFDARRPMVMEVILLTMRKSIYTIKKIMAMAVTMCRWRLQCRPRRYGWAR